MQRKSMWSRGGVPQVYILCGGSGDGRTGAAPTHHTYSLSAVYSTAPNLAALLLHRPQLGTPTHRQSQFLYLEQLD